MLAHPWDKNKNIPRMGHPALSGSFKRDKGRGSIASMALFLVEL
jgi:hypothetical protein